MKQDSLDIYNERDPFKNEEAVGDEEEPDDLESGLEGELDLLERGTVVQAEPVPCPAVEKVSFPKGLPWAPKVSVSALDYPASTIQELPELSAERDGRQQSVLLEKSLLLHQPSEGAQQADQVEAFEDNDIDARPWDFQAEECSLRAHIESFNSRRYDKIRDAEFSPVDNCLQSVLGQQLELPEDFRYSYELWLEREVFSQPIHWEELLCYQ
ncbi:hypothetical protein L345_12419, partial [Ophiophagus hannah]